MALNNFTPQFTPQNQQQCLLFTLPPELRNTIYEMALQCEEETINLVKKGRRAGSDAVCLQICLDNAALPSPALLCTCQQIHQESSGIFTAAIEAYFEKKFEIDLHGSAGYPDTYIIRTPDIYLARIHKLNFLLESGNLRVEVTAKKVHVGCGLWNFKIAHQSPYADSNAYAKLEEIYKSLCPPSYARPALIPMRGSMNQIELDSLLHYCQHEQGTMNRAMSNLHQ